MEVYFYIQGVYNEIKNNEKYKKHKKGGEGNNKNRSGNREPNSESLLTE